MQWAASCVGAACARISFRYVLSKVTARSRQKTQHAPPSRGRTVNYSRLGFSLSHRHNTYLQECTGQREPTYQLNIHDTKLLFLRFATEQSFSVDTGGGGRESNIHLIPYIIHTVLYVLNTYVPVLMSWSNEVQGMTRCCRPTFICFLLCELSRQYKSHIAGGEEPAEFPGAAVWEVGGELVRRGRTALFYHLGHAHHASWALEDFTNILPKEAPSQRTRPQSLSSLQQQVQHQSSFYAFLLEKTGAALNQQFCWQYNTDLRFVSYLKCKSGSALLFFYHQTHR